MISSGSLQNVIIISFVACIFFLHKNVPLKVPHPTPPHPTPKKIPPSLPSNMTVIRLNILQEVIVFFLMFTPRGTQEQKEGNINLGLDVSFYLEYK